MPSFGEFFGKNKGLERFLLPGFFDGVKIDAIPVGSKIYNVPSPEDMERMRDAAPKLVQFKDRIAQHDAKGESNFMTTATNAIAWVRKGRAALEEAKGMLGRREEDIGKWQLDTAEECFENAQLISKKLAERYHPEEEAA
jgi:hypothetical protein